MAKLKPKRKAIPKKKRFEVFKRDSFSCQYCGVSAPDVVLHIDHVIPVSKGGTNNILNLITSCVDCNLGKGATRLSDKTSVKKNFEHAKELSEKTEQIKMMAQWKKSLIDLKNTEIECIDKILSDNFDGDTLSSFGKRKVRRCITNFGLESAMDALYIAIGQYDDFDDVVNKMGGICYNKKNNMNPWGR